MDEWGNVAPACKHSQEGDHLKMWTLPYGSMYCWAHLSGETQIRVRIMALTALGFILYQNGLGLTKKIYGLATS